MKIVVLDRNTVGEDIDFSGLTQFGEVDIYDMSSKEEARQRVKDAEVIVANKVMLDGESLAEANELKLICLTATGTNNVDFSYTRGKNIRVTNVAGYSTDSVAQHTFAMLFYVMEGLAHYDQYVKSGAYTKSTTFCNLDHKFYELKGKTFGIIGLGAIGKEVAKIANAFGCRVVYYSTSGKNNDDTYPRMELEELLETADIVSVHAPLNENTKGLMCKERFSKMKKSAIFLNVGRGAIVNEEDLAWALEQNEIAAAGLDVICHEPMLPDCPLLRIQDSTKLLITPHIAWGTVEARQRVVDEVCKNIQAFLDGEQRNVV